MNYLIGLLIGTGAFFAALLYALFKRKQRQNHSNETSLIRRKLLAAVAVLIAFPLHWKMMASANQSDAKAPATSNDEKQTKKNAGGMDTAADRKNKLQQLKQFKEWEKIRSNWFSIATMKSKDINKMATFFQEKQKENRELFAKLVSAGLFTEEGIRVFNDIYRDRVFHYVRPMMATCYKPSLLGGRQMQSIGDLEERLKVLSEIYKKGTVKEDVLKQAEKNLLKDMEFIIIIDELGEKQSKAGDNWNKYSKVEKKILSYDTDINAIKDTIKIRDGVKEAMEIIEMIYCE